MFDNNDFFKESVIGGNEEKTQGVENEAPAVEIEITEPRNTEDKNEECSSLIFCRDIDYKNPYMRETHYEKNNKSRGFWRYVATGLCGMLIGAIICGTTVSLTKLAVNNDNGSGFAITQHSVEDSGSAVNLSTDVKKGQVLDVTQIAEKVGPSVVGIVNNQTFTTWNGGTYEQEGGSGSGIIISEDGYIITNCHVIEGSSAISVILNSGEKYSATVVGSDSKTDLAVLKINAVNLPAAELGVSADLKVGELAVAIGNPLGMEFQGSVTAGVISALNRSVEVDGRQYTLIQTDAAINSGNSGGALINKYGQVIGINSVKIDSSVAEGMGFAIPIDVAVPIVKELMNNGYVSGRPQVGVSIRDISESMSRYYNLPVGIYVVSVAPESGAEAAGIKIGDVIVKADDKTVTTSDELNKVRDTHKVGEKIKLTIVRSGTTIEIDVTLGEEKPSN